MSDEVQGAEAPDTQAPSDAPSGGDDGGGDDEVVVTRSQLDAMYKSARNSAFAEARKMFAQPRKPAEAKPTDDPRVKRGLELLAKYEAGEQFQTGVARALAQAKPSSTSPAAAAAPQQPSEIGQLLELMKMDIASRMADKLPKAPVAYASPGDQVRSELNAALADIPADDPQRHAKIQQTVLTRLRDVKVAPTRNKKG
jgi:hypothetical protein